MKIAFLILVAIGTFFPSDGTQGLLNPKSWVFLCTVLAFIFDFISKRLFSVVDQLLIVCALLFFGVLFFFSLIGIENGFDLLGQAKLFIITAFVPLSLAYLMDGKKLSFSTFVKTAIYTNFFYSLTKISLVLLHFLKVINLIDLMQKVGLRYMSMGIIGDIGRMQTSVDVLTPFYLYFVLSASLWGVHFSKGFTRLYLIISWLSIGFSFSRVFIFCGLMAHLMVWITKREKPFFISCIQALLISGLLIVSAGPEKVYKVFERRFLSEDSSRSDSIRERQITALIEDFEEQPFLGKGMGGHSEIMIRDRNIKYSYEVQWVAFLMQFGLVGIFIIGSFLLLFTYIILKPPIDLPHLGLFGMFLLWLGAGFTNPFLISLPSGIIYAFFLGASFSARCNAR